MGDKNSWAIKTVDQKLATLEAAVREWCSGATQGAFPQDFNFIEWVHAPEQIKILNIISKSKVAVSAADSLTKALEPLIAASLKPSSRPPTKRLSIQRRVDLIFAFFRDARQTILKRDPEATRHNAQLRKEIQRQIENAVRDALEAKVWPEFEFSNEELCPACGVPTVQHGTIKAGQWNITICAGVSGQNLFVIGPDAAMALIEQLKENDARESEPIKQPEIYRV